ncbi:hypothetical protein CSOJ01_01410 [Colletotrichum sojae]|uniref:Heterokaryon incompatibility domain-containing protein n=1 Tax=Colletotrichum sojae TaxID=2175907 RepID=A0A8H6JV99_9PEZI|nr:hypothetical protein CSOJ01_01410 [Colletotrichum sojae]
MFNWHDSACRCPDVVFADGTPFCLSCGNTGVWDESSSSQSQGAALKPPPSVKFNLCWPSSLLFIDHPQASQLGNAVPKPNGETSLSGCGNKRTVQIQNSGGVKTTLYEPLQARNIRTLEVLSGDFDEPIVCKLRIVDLALKPEFEALSYTWADENGDASKSQKIFVGNRHDILPVTASCANALQRLRFPKTSRRSRELWVDAVCINQESIQERSHQVGIMQYIYATALRVLIYLGEDLADPNPKTSAPWSYHNHGNTLDLDADMSNRPYFSRTWVIQEIASARSAWVLYGSRGARWQDFLEPLKKNQTSQPHPWLTLVAQPRHREMNELYDLLLATSKCNASDPRDKVFALLNLFIGANDAGFAADYSLSDDQVFAGTTAFILTQNPKNWHAIFAMIDSSRSSTLPSWAIDWLSPLCQSVSQPVPPVTRYSSESAGSKVRFLRNGGLVMKGHQLLQLDDCVVTGGAVTNGPCGIISGVEYLPHLSFHQREELLKAVPWAQMNDRLFVVPGLRDHLLALRPTNGTNRHTFVAICDRPSSSRAANVAHALGRRVSLLVSTWNEIFALGSSAWSTAEMWNDIKETCSLVKHFWDLEQNSINLVTSDGSQEISREKNNKRKSRRSIAETSKSLEAEQSHLNDLRVRLRSNPTILQAALKRNSYSDGKESSSTSTEGTSSPSLDPIRCTRRLRPGDPGERVKEELDVFLMQAIWDFGDTESFEPGRWPRSGSPAENVERSVMWCPDYFDDPSLSLARSFLVEMFGIDLRTEKHVSSTWFTGKLLGQDLTAKTGALNELLRLEGVDEESRLPSDITAMLWWLRDSLDIESETRWVSHNEIRNLSRSWASSFVELWRSWALEKETIPDMTSASLDFKPQDALWEFPKIPSSTKVSSVPEGKSDEGDSQSDTGDEVANDAGDDDKWDGLDADRAFLEQSVDGETWSVLLGLVRGTEQHLLPLEKLFTTDEFVLHFPQVTDSGKNLLGSRREPEWEDIHIV